VANGMYQIFLGPEGIITKTGEYIDKVITKILGKLTDFFNAGVDLLTDFLAGIKDKFFAPEHGILVKIVEFIDDAIDAVLDTLDDWIALGADLIAGVLEGLASGASKLWAFIKKLIRTAITGAFTESDAHSYSRKFAKLGMSWIQGLEIGMASEAKKANLSVGKIIADLMSLPISTTDLGIGVSGSPLANGSVIGSTLPGAVTTHIDQSISIEMTPTYQDIQSPASVRDDLSMALSMALR
ncbi:hypothetical protein LCGC14_0466580, partial [marine sediment metagenome]